MASDKLCCPLLSQDDAAAATVPFTELHRLRAVAEEFGFVIVTDVVDPMEMETKFIDDLAELGAKGLNLTQTQIDELGKIGRCQRRGMPQGRFAWACRLHPNVRRCYEVLHDNNDLVVSMDNPFFSSPQADEEFNNRSWPHVDHNKHDFQTAEWDVWQGLVYTWASIEPHSSTTVVWPRSHTDIYEQLMVHPIATQVWEQKRGHFTLLPPETWTEHKQPPITSHLAAAWATNARRVPVPAGGMLMWNSRTVHQGWSGGPRLAQPVCWEPRERRSAAARERKLRCAALGLPTTHWASLGIPHNLVTPKPDVAGMLKPTVQPLPATRPVSELWEIFQAPSWTQRLPAREAEVLEQAVGEEIKAVL
jgi:hypothetical protein